MDNSGHIYIEEPYDLHVYIELARDLIPKPLFFLSRFSWMPLNARLRIDGMSALEASSLLTTTDDYAQVLLNYWVTAAQLIHLIDSVDIATIQIEMFSGDNLDYYGSIRYFEWYFFLNTFPNATIALPSLKDLYGNKKGLTEKHECLGTEYGKDAFGHMETRISDESVAILGDIVLKTTPEQLDSIIGVNKLTCSPSALVSSLAQVASGRCHYVLTDALVDGNFEDIEDFSWLKVCDNNALPQDTIQKLPLGSVLCLGENGQIIGGAEKHVGEESWCVFEVR